MQDGQETREFQASLQAQARHDEKKRLYITIGGTARRSISVPEDAIVEIEIRRGEKIISAWGYNPGHRFFDGGTK